MVPRAPTCEDGGKRTTAAVSAGPLGPCVYRPAAGSGPADGSRSYPMPANCALSLRLTSLWESSLHCYGESLEDSMLPSSECT